MGTYITINANVVIKPENIDNAVQAVRELNQHDELKRGGSSAGEKWFSWVPEKYEDSINSIEDIFGGLLGFGISKIDSPEGYFVYDMSYSDKWGQHELFFIAISPFCEIIEVEHFCDELDYEYQQWKLVLGEDKKMHLLEPEVIINWPEVSDRNIVSYKTYQPINYPPVWEVPTVDI